MTQEQMDNQQQKYQHKKFNGCRYTHKKFGSITAERQSTAVKENLYKFALQKLSQQTQTKLRQKHQLFRPYALDDYKPAQKRKFSQIEKKQSVSNKRFASESANFSPGFQPQTVQLSHSIGAHQQSPTSILHHQQLGAPLIHQQPPAVHQQLQFPFYQPPSYQFYQLVSTVPANLSQPQLQQHQNQPALIINKQFFSIVLQKQHAALCKRQEMLRNGLQNNFAVRL